jgi:hypothetical protein
MDLVPSTAIVRGLFLAALVWWQRHNLYGISFSWPSSISSSCAPVVAAGRWGCKTSVSRRRLVGYSRLFCLADVCSGTGIGSASSEFSLRLDFSERRLSRVEPQWDCDVLVTYRVIPVISTRTRSSVLSAVVSVFFTNMRVVWVEWGVLVYEHILQLYPYKRLLENEKHAPVF